MPGLRLDDANLGVGSKKKESLLSTWDTFDHVEKRYMENNSLTPFSEPNQPCPEVTPEMLTTQDSRQYTEMYAQLLGWFNYVSELYSRVQCFVLQYSNTQEMLAAEIKQTHRKLNEGSKKPTNDEMNEILLTNADYREATLEMQKYQQAKIMLSARVDALERSLRVVSRQVEIRRMEVDQGRTESAMPARRPYGTSR